MRQLIEAAAAHARDNGAEIVEAYPIDAALTKPSSDAVYVGISSAFAAAGFVEVARNRPERPLMRRKLVP